MTRSCKLFLAGIFLALKLPYASGQSFVAVQAYNSPPTHINKDAYAIDFSQNGCDAYGKTAVAAVSGMVVLAEENGYNGGYGTQVLINSGNGIVARYAHMIPGTIPFAEGAYIAQGQTVGRIGNTGLVAGLACPTHPGTHIHFAMYDSGPNGSFIARKPEPISNYTDITEGRWYVSDNAIEPAGSGLSAEPAGGNSVENTAAVVATATATAAAETSTPELIQTSTIPPEPSGGVSATPSPTLISQTPSSPSSSEEISVPAASTTLQTATTSATSASTTFSSASASFNSSTLSINLSWQAPPAASGSVTYDIFSGNSSVSSSVFLDETSSMFFSYPLTDDDFISTSTFLIESTDAAGATSTFSLASPPIPNWFTTIQSIDDENSNGSWYDDNWYDLGTGFYGLIRSLTFEGAVDNSSYRASHLWLQEYLDPNYTLLNQTFTISDNAPFTNGFKKVTIGGLNIPLQPNKYYRLQTLQDYQNRSVILAGTSATGTAMWNEFIGGIGRVEHTYPFYPYISAIMVPDYPPLMPPNPPPSISVSFDSLNSAINISWAAATDPDTMSTLLTYQVNFSTSTTFSDSDWIGMGKFRTASLPVVFGNSYFVGIRTVDDLGNISPPISQAWSFPAGYVFLPSQTDHSVSLPSGAEKFVVPATTTLTGIALWAAPIRGNYCCSLNFVSIREDNAGAPGVEIASSDIININQGDSDAERNYNFSPAVILPAGNYWFSISNQPGGTNDTLIFGSASDAYPGGFWSSVPGADAYFRFVQANGP